MTAEEQDDYWAGIPDATDEELAAVFGGGGAEADLVPVIAEMRPVARGRYLSRAALDEIAAMHEPLRSMTRDEHRAMMAEILALHARPPRSIESVRSCGGAAHQRRARQPARRRVRRASSATSSSDGASTGGDPPRSPHLSALSEVVRP